MDPVRSPMREYCPSGGVRPDVGFGLKRKSTDEGCLLTVILLTLPNPNPTPPSSFPSYSVSSRTFGSSPVFPKQCGCPGAFPFCLRELASCLGYEGTPFEIVGLNVADDGGRRELWGVVGTFEGEEGRA